MKKYIAYIRVSTRKQQHGMDAQLAQIMQHVKGVGGALIAHYREQDSGKNNGRIRLAAAIDDCKSNGATLVISKLDRLSREVSFIFELQQRLTAAGVSMECLDLPEVNTLNLGIYATIAQHERETISQRTKAGLAAAKVKGIALGCPENLTPSARQKGLEVRRQKAADNENNRRAAELICAQIELATAMGAKVNYSDIMRQLNAAGYRTARGTEFTVAAVTRIRDRFCPISAK